MKYSFSSDDMDYRLEIRNNQRAFTSACAKSFIYFSITIYFFYFTYFSKYLTSDYLFCTILH